LTAHWRRDTFPLSEKGRLFSLFTVQDLLALGGDEMPFGRQHDFYPDLGSFELPQLRVHPDMVDARQQVFFLVRLADEIVGTPGPS